MEDITGFPVSKYPEFENAAAHFTLATNLFSLNMWPEAGDSVSVR